VIERMSPEERKSQIIQAALVLFSDRGYENTTVRNIIDEAGISKGGFYHHYDSKEQLLDDIAHFFVAEVLSILEEIAERDDLSGLEKVNEFIRTANAYKKERPVEVSALLSGIYSDDKNMHLENKILDTGRKSLTPIMKSSILQGIEEGEFDTDYPEEAAEMFVKLFMMHQSEMALEFVRVLSEDSEEGFEPIVRKYRFFQQAMEDMLGLERGALVLEEIASDLLRNLEVQLGMMNSTGDESDEKSER